MLVLEKIKTFNLRLSLLVLVISIIIGTLTAFNAKFAFIGVVSLIVTTLILVKWNSLYGVALVGFLVIPFGRYDFFHLKVPYINIDAFTALFYLFLLSIIVQGMIQKRKEEIKLSKSYTILLWMIFLYSLLGLIYKTPFFIAEIKVYMLYVIYFLTIAYLRKTNSGLDFILKVSVASTFILSLLVILIFFYKFSLFHPLFEGTFYETGTRVAISNLTIFIISVPLMLLILLLDLLDKKWKILIKITIPIALVSVLVSESRSLIIGVIVNVFLLMLFSNFLVERRKFGNVIKMGFTMMFLMVILAFTINVFTFGGAALSVFERFNEIFQTGTSGSYKVRQITNSHTMELIKQNLLGRGVGSSMSLIDVTGEEVLEGLFIDNSLLTILFKFGIPGTLCFLIFYLVNIKLTWKFYRQHQDLQEKKFALLILLCLPLYFINTFYMSAQLVMNGTVFGFLLLYFAYFFVSINNKQQTGSKCIESN